MAAQSDFETASGVHIVWGLVEGYLLYWDPVYALSCYDPQFRTDCEFFLLHLVPRRSSIRLTSGFVGYTIFSRDGDHSVNMYLPVVFLRWHPSLSPRLRRTLPQH